MATLTVTRPTSAPAPESSPRFSWRHLFSSWGFVPARTQMSVSELCRLFLVRFTVLFYVTIIIAPAILFFYSSPAAAFVYIGCVCWIVPFFHLRPKTRDWQKQYSKHQKDLEALCKSTYVGEKRRLQLASALEVERAKLQLKIQVADIAWAVFVLGASICFVIGLLLRLRVIGW